MGEKEKSKYLINCCLFVDSSIVILCNKVTKEVPSLTFLIPLIKSELPDRLGRDTSIKVSSS